MRAVLTSALALAFASPSAFAASGSLEQFSFQLSTTSQVLAGLATLALLYVVKARPQRVVKLDAPGRRYDPTVRGLFED